MPDETFVNAEKLYFYNALYTRKCPPCNTFCLLGDLHFAYALEKDENSGKIYKLSTYNEGLDVSLGGSYTQLKVTRSEKTYITQNIPMILILMLFL